MGKTKTMIYFQIKAPHLDPDTVTAKLGIQPTESYRNGDVIEDSFYQYRKHGFWSISSGYQEDLFLDGSFKQVVDPLRNKVGKINEICSDYGASCSLIVVSEMYSGQATALSFPEDIIQFAAKVHANLDLDLYPMPYQE